MCSLRVWHADAYVCIPTCTGLTCRSKSSTNSDCSDSAPYWIPMPCRDGPLFSRSSLILTTLNYVQIVNDVDVMQMQQAIDALICWATEWQLSVSVNKCCVLNVGNITHNTCFTFNISNVDLPVVDSTRDLGVLVTHDLSPSTHIHNIVATRRMATANKTCVSGKN